MPQNSEAIPSLAVLQEAPKELVLTAAHAAGLALVRLRAELHNLDLFFECILWDVIGDTSIKITCVASYVASRVVTLPVRTQSQQ